MSTINSLKSIILSIDARIFYGSDFVMRVCVLFCSSPFVWLWYCCHSFFFWVMKTKQQSEPFFFISSKQTNNNIFKLFRCKKKHSLNLESMFCHQLECLWIFRRQTWIKFDCRILLELTRKGMVQTNHRDKLISYHLQKSGLFTITMFIKSG